ncbi:hypothetical protein [Rhizobium sp. SSA_523]|uniref:hypothetical protein n=1 Tax=Rhizobium sp. SSA_523 TaxID=2952477 RepID=UPI002091D64C|nr:hypothetical protein [Rhizobium sp. SSA_523]MCO5734004.1 hypothetical protein [Rhizobium sp. SSA_523]WKC24648.1 hypothetical protein QTJ18_11445 [Rhizobium sp. SSA_523]
MKKRIASLLSILLLTACTTGTVEPIPGSITYGGQPRTKLTKSPVGSLLTHQFYSEGRVAQETYVLQPDRSLKLIERTWRPIVNF